MNNNTEILVHVSASSTGADDARYRQQALGFLQFTAARRHIVTDNGRAGIDNEASQDENDQEQSQKNGTELFSSDSLPNAGDVRLPTLKHLHDLAHSFSDTSPTVKVARTPAVQVHRTPAALAGRIALLKRPTTAPAAVLDTPIVGPAKRERANLDSWDFLPSVIPDSQPSNSSLKRAFADAWSSSLPDELTSSPIVKRQHTTQLGSSQHESQISNIPPGSSSQRSRSAPADVPRYKGEQPANGPLSDLASSQIPPAMPVSSGRPALQFDSSNYKCHDTVKESTVFEPPSTQQPPDRSPPEPSRSLHFPQLSSPIRPISSQPEMPTEYEEIWSQIRAPPPPTCDSDFKTHVTPSLRTITSKLPLQKSFKPKTQTRQLRPLERGYWRFCIPIHWSRELRTKFWRFLEDLIGRGKAGWGVRIERLVTLVRQPTQDTGEQSIDSIGPNEGAVKEEVTAFCWGEVVGEIWLVLWLASDRKLRGLGSEWVDGGGETIITME